ncbi:MAG: ZIP family metal transporter [Gammaproteobacteria bacterium]|nr:ZIP family metal transporter [Gammaproteobacteria bacterium]
MTTNWIWVLALSGSAALASAFGALLLSTLGERRLAALLPSLVSFSTGVMLGAACLDLLPEAFSGVSAPQASHLGLALAGGILVFFSLEKLIHWHHAHDVASHTPSQTADNRATTVMVLTGTSLHNFLAGVLLAAAVLVDVHAALILFAAILAHHIPQQVGDFSVLMMTGYRRGRALALTLASSAALFAGGVIAFALLRHAREALPFIMAIAAASLIYIALADLIPRLRGGRGRQSLAVIALVAVGIGVIYAVVRLLPA